MRGRLNTAQKTLVVIALGVVAYVLGVYITTRRSYHAGRFVAFDPGLRTPFPNPSMDPAAVVAVWLALVAVWLGVSLWLFSSPDEKHDVDD